MRKLPQTQCWWNFSSKCTFTWGSLKFEANRKYHAGKLWIWIFVKFSHGVNEFLRNYDDPILTKLFLDVYIHLTYLTLRFQANRVERWKVMNFLFTKTEFWPPNSRFSGPFLGFRGTELKFENFKSHGYIHSPQGIFLPNFSSLLDP